MAELLGVNERSSDYRTITAREHETERRLNRMPVVLVDDPDAVAFIDAAGLTNPMHHDAIFGLVADLKDAGIWSKLHAAWPMIGGSDTAHKWNLKDPRDLDAAFRLDFSGGWTHSSNGVLPNGSNAYANTHLNPASVLAANSGSMGFYSRTAGSLGGQPYDMGCDDGDTIPVIVIARYSNGNAYLCYGNSTFTPNAASSDGSGLWAVNRFDAEEATTRGLHNGSSFATAAVAVTLPSRNIFLGANNRAGSPTYYSARELAFNFVSDGLTLAEHAALYDAVLAFQTTLGRQV